jgi:hypothetical protein
MPIFARHSPHNRRGVQNLTGARRRAKELGILDEFWEFVSAGDVPGAMDLLALRECLEEERLGRRRAEVLWFFAILAISLALGWWHVSP